jgi:predicted amidohydrolase YtcJ
MMIRGAQLEDGRICDVRIANGRIAAIGALTAAPEEEVLDAACGLLLPGLHDQHTHLIALAAAMNSVRCGPPQVHNPEVLRAALDRPGQGWLRGVGYHESVAGMLDAAMLDRLSPPRPVRIQHRSGRMWFFNSAGLDIVAKAPGAAERLERENGRFTGRLFDADLWLRTALRGSPPSLDAVGARLARYGITGVTDLSPANDAALAAHFAAEQATQRLPQNLALAGRQGLRANDMGPMMRLGPAKLHLHEADLPDLDAAADFIRAAHARGRRVAVHCVTDVELLFTLAAFDETGALQGDRIEHASIARPDEIARMTAMGLWVAVQPNFIAERGDQYLTDVDPENTPHLYRLKSLRDAGLMLAAGSDAPFGDPDPWAAMQAAVRRHTPSGIAMGLAEALTPEQALDLFLRDPMDFTQRRRVEAGAAADLCLLDCNWNKARADLSAAHVRSVFVAGRAIFDRIDQAPF